jgi:EAL domain-containing protein (putative c-di-GMP-specific phosphodiesterase class I)
MGGMAARTQQRAASADLDAERADRQSAHGSGSGKSLSAESAQPERPSSLRVCIHNLDEIGRAYGSGARHAAIDHIRTLLKFELRGKRLKSVEHALRRLGEHPVAHDGQRFLLDISLSPTSDFEASAQNASFGRGTQAIPNTAWCRRYRADMALAVQLFDDLAAGDLVFAWQPIRNADGAGDDLYDECLLRSVGQQGEIESAGNSIAALERLGLMRALDRHVMDRALNELENAPRRRLGVNISAQSLINDHWWGSVLARLEGSPSIAQRLFVEITEGSPLTSFAEAVEFCAILRRFGCRIVLDDFGAGHAGFRSILTLSPDIVKIDRYFVAQSIRSDAARKAFVHLVGLARSFGAEVVAEGIESPEESRIARQAGALWQQGYHLGRPSITRPWRGQLIDGDAAIDRRKSAEASGCENESASIGPVQVGPALIGDGVGDVEVRDAIAIAWATGLGGASAESFPMTSDPQMNCAMLTARTFPERVASRLGSWM